MTAQKIRYAVAAGLVAFTVAWVLYNVIYVVVFMTTGKML